MDILDLENQLDEKTKLLISKMEEQIESKDKEIDNLKKELAFLKGQLLNKNRKIFGQSSEQVDSRQTLSNWIISCATELKPVFNYMKEELLKRNYIHADETYLKVIEENGKDSNSKRFMWLYRSGGIENPVILYDYQKTRSGSCAEEFLE